MAASEDDDVISMMSSMTLEDLVDGHTEATLELSVNETGPQAGFLMNAFSASLEYRIPRALAELLGLVRAQPDCENDIPDPKPEKTSKICTTCDEALPLESFPSVTSLTGCEHLDETCAGCWHGWLEHQVQERQNVANNITCVQCPKTLDVNAVQGLSTPEIFERYLEATLRDAMSAHQDFRHCFYPSCNFGQIHEGNNIFTCVACKRKSCVDCHAEWHSGQTCEEFRKEKQVVEHEEQALEHWEYLKEVDRRRRRGKISNSTATTLMGRGTRGEPVNLDRIAAEEAEAAATVAASSKQCPNCPSRIQKTYGCDKMRCLLCLHDFCWLCLADYRQIRRTDNSAHGRDCRHWRPPVPGENGTTRH